jgi:hypothetical protein
VPVKIVGAEGQYKARNAGFAGLERGGVRGPPQWPKIKNASSSINIQ